MRSCSRSEQRGASRAGKETGGPKASVPTEWGVHFTNIVFSMGIYSNSIWPSNSLSSGQGKVTWDDVNKETVESAFLFFTSIFKSVKIPSKPNYVSLRRETKEGLIYYLISKYTVTSRCKEKPIHQFQKAKSTFLVIGLGIKFLC